MNKKMIMLMAAALALLSASGQVKFIPEGAHPPIKIHLSDNHTSLNDIYVVYDTQGVGMAFNSSTGVPATWQSYDYPNGILHTENIPVRWDGMSTILNQVIPNKGYIITEGTTPYYCWVVNYADYFLELNDLFYNNEEPCNLITFHVDGHGEAIPYYTIEGIRQIVDREIKLTYNTMVWDDSTHWSEQTIIENFAALDQGIEIAPPLCNTSFLMTGDRFLEEWNMGIGAESDKFYTQAVDCNSSYWREPSSDDNVKGENSGLTGSAPMHIVFTGYPTEAVSWSVWEMALDPDFEDIILQYNQDEVDYVFDEFGTYYMRYRVSNADGSCEAYGETYTINVSESYLECPNVFSPDGDGVNDYWKVSYNSLVEFHCWIYNRWGSLVYEFTDPGGGWDGHYRGRLVDTGVYYYVVTALGSDGKKWKKRGDITILRFKGGTGTSNSGANTGGL